MNTFGMVPPNALGYLAMDPDAPLPYSGSSRVVSDVSAAGIDALLETAGPGSGSTLASVELRSLGGALARRTPGLGARATIDGDYLMFFAVGGVFSPEHTGSTSPRRLISPVIAVSLRIVRSVISETSAMNMATPGARPVLRDGAGRHMHMDVALLEAAGIDAERGGAVLDDAQRGLGALASSRRRAGPVRMSLPEPGMRVASMNRMSPPTGVQARPVATPGTLVRIATSLSNCGGAENGVRDRPARCGSDRSALRRCARRHAAAPCRSRARDCARRPRACSCCDDRRAAPHRAISTWPAFSRSPPAAARTR